MEGGDDGGGRGGDIDGVAAAVGWEMHGPATIDRPALSGVHGHLPTRALIWGPGPSCYQDALCLCACVGS